MIAEILKPTFLRPAIKSTLHRGADGCVDLQIWPEMVHVWHMLHPELKAGVRAIQAGGGYVRAATAG